MSNRFQTLRTVVLVAILASCEYDGDHSFSVKNNSTYTVDAFIKYRVLDSVLFIQPNETRLLGIHADFNGLRDLGDDFLLRNGIDSIFFRVMPDSLVVLKDPMKRSNWEYSAEPHGKNGKSGENRYTFRLTEDDFGLK